MLFIKTPDKNTAIPHKKSKNSPLTEEQKKENRESASAVLLWNI